MREETLRHDFIDNLSLSELSYFPFPAEICEDLNIEKVMPQSLKLLDKPIIKINDNKTSAKTHVKAHQLFLFSQLLHTGIRSPRFQVQSLQQRGASSHLAL